MRAAGKSGFIWYGRYFASLPLSHLPVFDLPK